VEDVCEDMVYEYGYSLCRTRFRPDTEDVLYCQLDLSEVNVNEIDMNTYLVRADAIYEFHDVTTTTFTVDNCDAI
jgi:hypothetical protein